MRGLAIFVLVFSMLSAMGAEAADLARGAVFEDLDRDGRRDAGEPGLAGIRVSNGREIVLTDADGDYELTAPEHGSIFVIKPSGWAPHLSRDNRWQNYYLHKPMGSPPSSYPGSAPTGPLPKRLDFALERVEEAEAFRVLLLGDTQPRDTREIEYIAHDVVESLVGVESAFAVVLGDVLFDDLSLFGELNEVLATLGVPMVYVPGNHDYNFDSPDDDHGSETFEAAYGPRYWSFDLGQVHFVVLDDVLWQGKVEDPAEYPGANYAGGLDEWQLTWLTRDLELVPPDMLVVPLMHIPFTSQWEEASRDALFRLLERRTRCFSVAAHWHTLDHLFLGSDEHWLGAGEHHQYVNATVCGSWWSGAPDELGIPHTTQRDGTPNGWSFAQFDGTGYRLGFRAARRPADHQMSIWAPDRVGVAAAAETEFLVNVFAGSERSRVEYRWDGRGEWRGLERVRRNDPYFEAMKALEAGEKPPPGLALPSVRPSSHLWRGVLPESPPPGIHVIHVRAEDMFGQTQRGLRLIRIE